MQCVTSTRAYRGPHNPGIGWICTNKHQTKLESRLELGPTRLTPITSRNVPYRIIRSLAELQAGRAISPEARAKDLGTLRGALLTPPICSKAAYRTGTVSYEGRYKL